MCFGLPWPVCALEDRGRSAEEGREIKSYSDDNAGDSGASGEVDERGW